ncbi:MAG: MoaD/ThiS family protein [Planctomycetota bacterium]|nr:MoaD/ThiS family protein [Planctomycetota bacterium]MDA1180323.1 MoaD/ThiS family protein [Planctomycetota bacterium]
MKQTVKMFAGARDAVDCREIEMSLPEGATVGQLRELLHLQYPQLRQWPTFRIAVDQRYVADDFILLGKEELAYIPPVSGG